jgi:hypothetical protein
MDAAYLSFAEQAMRYFDRPHGAVAREPVGGPAAWRGDALDARDWTVRLDDHDVAELERARDGVRRRGIELAGMRSADFPLPGFAARVAAWRDELRLGRGFLVVRGLPVARWGDDDAALVYWGLGLHLGRPGAQNAMGDLLGHVVDTGEENSESK